MSMSRFVRRHLEAEVKGAVKGVPVFPGFYSFEQQSRPGWWSADLASNAWGPVLGIHEHRPGRREGAIVVTEDGVALLGGHDVRGWVGYLDIARWDPLSKDPVAPTLRVWSRGGDVIELPFDDGGAFAFVQFLGAAIDECHRRAR